jgi:RNA polymerase sigma-70 factor (ECF subfamily)
VGGLSGQRRGPKKGAGTTPFRFQSPFRDVELELSVSTADPDVLAEVYREQAPKLWRALVAYTGDRDVAGEALAEAFAQAVARGPDLRKPERWVWTAAFRIAAGELKRRSHRSAPIQQMSRDRTDALELVEALAKLPPRQRAALVLHYYGGYKAGEIAVMLGCTGATVRVHLSAGRTRLRQLLEVDDE